MKLHTHTPCVLLTLALSGCGSPDDGVTAEAIELAFIPKTSNNLVFSIGNDGAQFGARYLSYEEDSSIEVEYLAPRDLDPKAERDLIRERTNAGLAAARARGRSGGRPSALSADQVRAARRMYEQLSLIHI